MAKTSLKVKAARKPKFKVRGYTRCQRCGRPHAVYQKFGICRICFREMAHRGELPGITKASWSKIRNTSNFFIPTNNYVKGPLLNKAT